MLMLYGPDTPPKSRAEMDELASLVSKAGCWGAARSAWPKSSLEDLAPLIAGFLLEDEFRASHNKPA